MDAPMSIPLIALILVVAGFFLLAAYEALSAARRRQINRAKDEKDSAQRLR